jgi:hypothetical protein
MIGSERNRFNVIGCRDFRFAECQAFLVLLMGRVVTSPVIAEQRSDEESVFAPEQIPRCARK